MSTLHIILDPSGLIQMPRPEVVEATGLKVAVMSVPDDLSEVDIYSLAKRLAELLLEQFAA